MAMLAKAYRVFVLLLMTGGWWPVFISILLNADGNILAILVSVMGIAALLMVLFSTGRGLWMINDNQL
jgi:hypothetical protein